MWPHKTLISIKGTATPLPTKSVLVHLFSRFLLFCSTPTHFPEELQGHSFLWALTLSLLSLSSLLNRNQTASLHPPEPVLQSFSSSPPFPGPFFLKRHSCAFQSCSLSAPSWEYFPGFFISQFLPLGAYRNWSSWVFCNPFSFPPQTQRPH